MAKSRSAEAFRRREGPRPGAAQEVARRSPVLRRRLRCAGLLAAIVLAALPCCAGAPSSKPGVFEVRKERVELLGRSLNLFYVTPAKPRSPLYLVLYATGDAGWIGAAGAIVEHMADEGYYVAAIDAREVVSPVKHAGELVGIPEAAAFFDAVIVQSRRALALPEATPVIVTGYSRGANLVVFTSGVKSLQHHVGGAVAVALTRETDFLKVPEGANLPSSVKLDDKGRIQTYPAIELAGPIPFAVIQSKGDKYVPAEEARRLFGPDSPTRRLYQVDASNHGFSGGKDELIRDLDDALKWIEATAKAK